MATKELPEWATVGATVYAREQGGSYWHEARLRKGTISRVTATSIFVRTNLAAGEAAGEDRYTLQRWNDAPRLYGNNSSDYYTRTLVSEEDALAELERIKVRKDRERVVLAARRCAESANNRLTEQSAQEAIQALQAYLDHPKEA